MCTWAMAEVLLAGTGLSMMAKRSSELMQLLGSWHMSPALHTQITISTSMGIARWQGIHGLFPFFMSMGTAFSTSMGDCDMYIHGLCILHVHGHCEMAMSQLPDGWRDTYGERAQTQSNSACSAVTKKLEFHVSAAIAIRLKMAVCMGPLCSLR